MSALLDRILRAGEGKTIRRLEKIAASVNSLEADFHAMSDEELRGMTAEFKTRLAAGEELDGSRSALERLLLRLLLVREPYVNCDLWAALVLSH